jgi:hypothetical protein
MVVNEGSARRQQPEATTVLLRRRVRQDPAESAKLWRATSGRRPMKRNLQAFVLSLGGLLAVAGSGFLVLWAVLN